MPKKRDKDYSGVVAAVCFVLIAMALAILLMINFLGPSIVKLME